MVEEVIREVKKMERQQIQETLFQLKDITVEMLVLVVEIASLVVVEEE